ncbi:leucine-rich repeat-containing protein 74A-like [Parambassis ranga]|uniref:Leucine-rich repeat-containing protein 74A-like n=1 Tax=Parambassis ranga TaxID=210632 RepID=A0A6P7HT20_9TELE|nr:leucine-rich repeat-containing protein 74A-like [Parambassis ranga]
MDTTCQTQSMSVAELYLQACQETGATPIRAVLHNLGATTSLNLNYYFMGPLRAKALAIALKNDKIITNLELSHNTLKAKGTAYLMKALSSNTSVRSLDKYKFEELDLSLNKFKGGEHLGQLLARNGGIKVLNLSGNCFSKNSAVALMSSLKENSTLKQLQLSFCVLGRSEAQSLGQALSENSTLVLLDLSYNWIDDKAVRLLCQGLTTNNTLGVLKLSHNPITSIGALALLEAVKNNRNSALEKIDISSVFVDETFMELLEETLQTHPALDVQYSVMSSVTRNLSALQIFKNFFEEQSETIMDFFQALDEEKTMTVSTSAFRAAVKEANIPLDRRQLEWLINKFDKEFTAKIAYSQFAKL